MNVATEVEVFYHNMMGVLNKAIPSVRDANPSQVAPPPPTSEPSKPTISNFDIVFLTNTVKGKKTRKEGFIDVKSV